ncbi:helix-turn-helix transcriptional regulator [Myceligenerans xiligouense]|uniref:Putative DNA-binding transcriptional regulator YafY n=1 Tax=Myceligenerans xiligouense TaxID=253184 RepID=A0A3N4YM06_9MICO|nr:WYL domain-containing protein [Myceligenerans xiligouense]RPF21157.1 putative DNA-binding transcriptional regulator YafY [Myceligenerans xiligouense]
MDHGRDERDAARGTTERVLTLLGLLQQRRVWTGPELAARMRVTTRTVRRDVDRLRALGYPVHAGHGSGGGYQLGAGQVLPPLLLDDEEVIAVAAALLAGTGDAGTGGEAALRTLTKLDQVLPSRLRADVRALAGSVESFGRGRAPADPDVLLEVARACRDGVELGFGYRTRGGGEGRRRVEPYRLVASERQWYLLAFDRDRDDWRTFRVDRMSEVRARTWRFEPRAVPAKAAAYVQESVADRVYPRHARFLVHANADVVRAQVPASAAVVRPRDAATCEIRAGGHDLDLLLLHVTLLGHDFEVLEPAELAHRCEAMADRLRSAGRRVGGPPVSS